MKKQSKRDFRAEVLKTHSLSEKDFSELVDFFRELMRLDSKPRPQNQRQRLMQILRNRFEQLKAEKRNDLLQQLKRLENL